LQAQVSATSSLRWLLSRNLKAPSIPSSVPKAVGSETKGVAQAGISLRCSSASIKAWEKDERGLKMIEIWWMDKLDVDGCSWLKQKQYQPREASESKKI
jgi:hypothetical protein